jgi:hypothetical protein
MKIKYFILSIFFIFSPLKGEDTLKPFISFIEITQGSAKTGNEFTLTFYFKALMNLYQTRIIFEIPKGIDYLGGALDTILYLLQSDSISLSVDLKAIYPGPYCILTHVILSPEDTISFLQHFVLDFYIISFEDTAIYSYKPEPNVEYNLISDEIIGVEPSEKPPLESYYTVSGYVKYKNESVSPPSLDPLEGILIQLINQNGSVVASARTDENGYYSITAKQGKYFLRIYAKDYAGEVEKYWRMDVDVIPWFDIDLDCSPGPHLFLNIQINLYSNLTVNYTAENEKSDMARILWCIQRNKRWVLNNTNPPRTLEYVQVNYPPKLYIDLPWPFKDVEYSLKKIRKGAFALYLGTLQEVKVKIPVPIIGEKWYGVGVDYDYPYQIVLIKQAHIWDPNSGVTLSHEWAHCLQINVLGNKIPYGKTIYPHNLRTVSNHGHAFTEGFAEFASYGLWIQEHNFPLITLSKREEFYPPDIILPYYRGSEPYLNTNGSIVEGAIMQFFWDLFDNKNTNDHSPNFDDDGVYGNFSKVINTHVAIGPEMTEAVSEVFTIDTVINGEEVGIKFKLKLHRFPGGNDNFIEKFKQKWEDLGYGNVTEVYNVDVHPFNYLEPYPVPNPTNFTGTSEENTVHLSWNDNAQNEGAYILKRRKEGENFWMTILLSKNTTSYIDQGLAFNTKYYYKVAALTCDTPGWAGPISVTTNVLNPPTNLQATSSSPYNSVSLTWKDNSNYETGYEVWRKGLDNIWRKIATLGQNAQSYTDASISPFNDYFYKVRAIKGNITSEFSNTCWVTTSPILLSKDKVDTFYFNDGKGKKIIYKNGKWHSVFNTGKRVYYSYSNDNGLTWNTDTIVKINLPNRWVEDACLAIDDQNRIWVFYEYNGPSNFKIKYRVKAGNNWSEEDSIQRYGKNPCAFSLNGSVYLVFESPIDKEGIKVYMCEFLSSGSLNIDSLRERWIGKGSISGSYFENIFLSAQYGSSSPNMYHSLMYYKWGMNAFDSIQIDNKIIKEYNRQHFVDKNVLCFLEKKYAEDIESLRVIKYKFSDNKWEWFISQNFQRMRFPTKIKNPRIFYDGTDLFIIYERDSLNYYYIEGFRITNNGGLIRYRFSILPSTIKTYPDIYIYKDINKIHLGIMYNSSEGIIFKRKEIPFAPPPIPEPIDENISLLDIPSNNTPRISLFDNSLHILYSKNDSVFDAILKGNEILKKFLGYGKNPSLFLCKGNLYTIWAYNDTTGLEEIRFSKYDTSWSEIKSSYRALNTNYFGIGATSFYIENDTGYVAFESTRGYIYHILPLPERLKLWLGKTLISYKFPLNNPLNYEILYEDFIPGWIPPQPIETLRVERVEFYEKIVPILISPSIVSDKGISNIIWDGINKFLKIYKIGNDTIVKIIYPEYGNVKEPYAFKENSIVKFLWVEYDKFYMMKQKINFI